MHPGSRDIAEFDRDTPGSTRDTHEKLITVLGARLQFVKAGVVSSAISKTQGLEECLVHTGQHYDANMSDVFFEEFGLPAPAHHLGIGMASRAQDITLIEPVGYAEMMRLVECASAVLTDSGGLQKEAFFLGKPVHIFRTETEWVELIDTSWAGLLPPGSDRNAAVATIRQRGGTAGGACTAYGDGKAALKVVDAVVRHLG